MSTSTATQGTPAGFGRGRRSNTIAVVSASSASWFAITPQVDEFGPEEGLGPWDLTAISGLMCGATLSGFHLTWRHWCIGESPEDVAASVLGHDAVIVLAPQDVQHPLVDILVAAGLPVVLAYSRWPDPRVCWVACDNHGGIVRAVRHLARLEHRRIGYLGGPREVPDTREREQGYLDAMLGAGLTVQPEWVLATGASGDGAEVRAAVDALLTGLHRPTAVVCGGDPLALAVLDGARRLDLRVPAELAVTGFDDLPEALQVIPHLTTVRQPTFETAKWACYLAACCVAGQLPTFGAWQLDLPTTLVIRDSCGGACSLSAGPSGLTPESDVQAVRQELEWRLRQLSGMEEEMHELLYVASHDLRAPLITIQGFASTLQRKYADTLDDSGQRYLQRIGHSVDSMRRLIDGLLALSRAHNQPLHLQLVPTRDVLLRVVADLEGLIQEKHARIRVARRMPTVLADELALYQVFLNLISNALKYSGDQPAPMVSVGSQSLSEEYEFAVRDNGIGIAPEHHEEVFQAFRRLGQAQVEGVGIGLSTVKRTILRLGGRVWVDSQPGRGATFRFTLPRRSAQETEGQA